MLLIVCASQIADAQTSYDDFKKQANERFQTFRTSARQDYESFRKKANDDYILLLNRTWQRLEEIKSHQEDEDKTPTPPLPYDNKPIENKSNPIKNIVEPEPIVPQPQPIEPIKESPKYDEWLSFSFFGTELRVRLDKTHCFNIGSISEKNIASAWANLSTDKYNNVIADCLNLRKSNRLCDWAYLLMLKELAESFAGKNTNEATLLMAYIYCQSGYKMRLGYNKNRLYMLYACQHKIYNKSYFSYDNTWFYPFEYDNNDSLYISSASFPNERALSLLVAEVPILGSTNSERRHLASKNQNITTSIPTIVNSNLIDFYNTYPTSEINQDFMTRWALYAKAPLSQSARESLYPALRNLTDNVSQFEAVNRILNFVQTAFEYEYDNAVWGGDRAFFAEETLFYPYCDCEDRSILFSILVRDLINLEVALVYYPGHLAAAVHFTSEVNGDYFTLNGKKFTICDPTYINAPVGATMPQYADCSDLSVILLE